MRNDDRFAVPRNNHRLNDIIEWYIEVWSGTSKGQDVKNMYENGSSYETICEYMDVAYEQFRRE